MTGEEKSKGSARGVVMLLTNAATFDQRPLKEAHSLARAGRPVTILAWDRDLETRTDSVSTDGVVIKRMRVGAGHGTPMLTVPRLMLFYLWCIAHLAFSRADAIHCHDVDTLPAGVAVKALKLMRPRLVYDMHDLPEVFLRFFPLTRFTQAVSLATSRRLADAVIVVNNRFVTYLSKIGFDTRRLVVVMNVPPLGEGREPKRRAGRFNVLYYGWLAEERGVELLIKAVDGLEGVTLSFAGRGNLAGLVRDAAARNPAVKYLGWLRTADLQPVIEKADLIPSLYEPMTRNTMMATPGKLFTAMSLSIPLLVPGGTYQAEIVEKFKCGLVVDWRDPLNVRRAIQRMVEDCMLYEELSLASYSAFRASFSWEVMGTRLSSLYDKLLSGT